MCSIFFFLVNPTKLFVQGVFPKYIFNYVCDAGPLYIYYAIFYFVSFIFTTAYLFVGLRQPNVDRYQVKYVILAQLGAVGGGSVFFLTFNLNWPPYIMILYAFYPLIIAYAIIKYRLMGIKVLASKVYTYLLISAFSLVFFHITIFVDFYFLGGIYSYKALMFSPWIAVLYSISLLPVLNKIQSSSDVIFYRNNAPRQIIKDLSLELSSSINLYELIGITSEIFRKVLASESLKVYLKKADEKKEVFYCVLMEELKVGPTSLIYKPVVKNRTVLVRDELKRKGETALVKEMDKSEAKLIAPLVLRNKVIGLLYLGEKVDGDAYTREDIDFLDIISSQAAVAIENARLYKEVDDFNKTLKQKVDVQTKEIREKADHLKKLMDMRSEFLDITSHQLRTPVTVIKGVLSMLEEGSIPPSKRKEFLRGAFEKSIKLGEIINDILRASEMDSESFVMNLKPVDLNEILRKIEEDKLRTAQIKNVKLDFKIPKKTLSPVLSDAKYLEQAIVNMINNSFQYTLKGSIHVMVEQLSNAVVIRVKDTGIGIPKDQIPKLFQKFARADNAVNTFTDGSGLGLFIIKQIVDATPGAKIEIEKTELNKGTVFALTIPLAKSGWPLELKGVK
ncbi:GAF domain-containing sensor histidine kinase [Candidatus Falkowbacteria bacterium]|nr:GAF domain-containing sensor histidine kinase [Candidatus Falkowbacteria bacterium]